MATPARNRESNTQDLPETYPTPMKLFMFIVGWLFFPLSCMAPIWKYSHKLVADLLVVPRFVTWLCLGCLVESLRHSPNCPICRSGVQLSQVITSAPPKNNALPTKWEVLKEMLNQTLH